MFKKIFVALLMAMWLLNVCAQDSDDNIDKKTNYYLSLQVNQLLRQLLNFSGSNSPVNNPYLIKFGIRKTGGKIEYNTGLGYTYDRSIDENLRKVENNDLFLRIGFSNKKEIFKNIEVGIGPDLVATHLTSNSETVSGVSFGNNFDSTKVNSTNKTLGFGLGPQLNISYYITTNILLGTEASYYFVRTKQKQNVTTVATSNFNGLTEVRTTSSNLEENNLNFSLRLPVAIFLTIKF